MTVQKSCDAVAVSSSSVEEKEEGKGLNFLQRMKIRDKREVEAGMLASVETPRLKKYPAAKRKKTSVTSIISATPNPIEQIDCSQIIHGFETLKANSGKKINRSQGEKAKGSNKVKNSFSAEDIEQEDDSEELNISEFDEDDLKPPPAGSFSLSPTPSMLSKTKNLLGRFTTDTKSSSITNKAKKMSIEVGAIKN